MWGAIRNISNEVVKDLIIVKEMIGDRHSKFIDIGSGWGNILRDARFVFDDNVEILGVEINKSCYEYSKKRHNVINDDANNLDLSVFDIIYFYQPYKTLEKEIALERKILNEAKSGTIIMHYSAQFLADKINIGIINAEYNNINNNILIKK